MRRMGSRAAAALICAVALTGCGGSDEDFCTSYKALEGDSSELTTAETFDTADGLKDNAPGEIEDDVEVITDYLDEWEKSLEDTGVDLDTPEEDLSQGDQEKLGKALEGIEVEQEKVTKAADNITTWTEENCKEAS